MAAPPGRAGRAGVPGGNDREIPGPPVRRRARGLAERRGSGAGSARLGRAQLRRRRRRRRQNPREFATLVTELMATS